MLDRLRLLERRDIDGLIILDVSATPAKRSPRFEELRSYCDNLFCPITVGGGIRSVATAKRILAEGADAVAIGTAAIETPDLINELSQKFGSQSVSVSIDVKDGVVFSRCGTHSTGKNPRDWAAEVEQRGAGEILLTDIERDGTMEGYNLDLISGVSSAVSIPVVGAGGAGTYAHFEQALGAGAHAVACGAMFQFREETPKGAARFLASRGIATRV
jgi:cyclase